MIMKMHSENWKEKAVANYHDESLQACETRKSTQSFDPTRIVVKGVSPVFTSSSLTKTK